MLEANHYTAIIALAAVIGLVILSKRLLYSHIRLRGGMPSGHSAFGFSCWIISVFLTKDTLIAGLVLILAALIARSRIQNGTHTLSEVLAGAMLGILVTAATFQFLGV